MIIIQEEDQVIPSSIELCLLEGTSSSIKVRISTMVGGFLDGIVATEVPNTVMFMVEMFSRFRVMSFLL